MRLDFAVPANSSQPRKRLPQNLSLKLHLRRGFNVLVLASTANLEMGTLGRDATFRGLHDFDWTRPGGSLFLRLQRDAHFFAGQHKRHEYSALSLVR